MLIDKNSWHFKVWRRSYTYRRPPSDLCTYFWNVCGTLLRLGAAILVTAFATAILLASATCFLWIGDLEHPHKWQEPFLIIGVIEASIVLMLSACWVLAKLQGWRRGRKRAKEVAAEMDPPQQGMTFREMLKARVKAYKEKHCPLVTYYGDEHDDDVPERPTGEWQKLDEALEKEREDRSEEK